MAIPVEPLALRASLIEAISRELRAAPDVEHCGLLVSARDSPVIDDRLAYDGPLRPRNFRLPEVWMLTAFLRQRQIGRRVVGYYHTHPTGSILRPSPWDIEGHPPGSLVLLVGDESLGAIGWTVWRSNFENPGWRAVESVQVL